MSGIITISGFFFFLFLGPPMEIIRKHFKHFSPVANNTFNELLLKEFDFLLIIYCLREKKPVVVGRHPNLAVNSLQASNFSIHRFDCSSSNQS